MIKKKDKLGAPSDKKKKKNRYLDLKGGISLIEKFPGVDFMPYESKKKRKKRGD